MELADAKLGYMGRPDAIVKMSGDTGLTVIDYKKLWGGSIKIRKVGSLLTEGGNFAILLHKY
jgi:hypothetical protein